MSELKFHWADYLVFVIVLLISASIGIFYGWRDRKKKSAEAYLLADRNMKILPVSLSMFVSWTSAISFLTDPVQVYMYGLVYWYIGIGYSLAMLPIAHYFGPRLYRLRVLSVNEYIKTRYNRPLSLFVSLMTSVTMLMFMSVALYAPSLALSQVTELEVWMSILIVGAVGTFYTSLGGMKAVLWADTVQCFVMVAGLLAVIIRGAVVIGGIHRIWEITEMGGRINLNKIDPNPFQSGTLWTFLVGGFFRVMHPYASSQVFVQRYCSLPNERAVKIACYINLPIYFVMVTLFSLTGLILYAFYHDCDPLSNGQITKSDQMVPLLTLQVLGFLPGLPGLFMSCIFSACLSTLSSIQPALSALWLGDIIMPLYHHHNGRKMSERLSSHISRALNFTFGVLTIGLAFALKQTSNSDLFAMSNGIIGALTSPISALFMIGLILSFINTFSVLGGAVLSIGVMMWLTIGSSQHPKRGDHLPISTQACPTHISTVLQNGTTAMWDLTSFSSVHQGTPAGYGEVFSVTDIYKLPPIMYNMLGPLLTLIGSLIFYGLHQGYKCCRSGRSQKLTLSHLSDDRCDRKDLSNTKDKDLVHLWFINNGYDYKNETLSNNIPSYHM